MEAGWNQGPLVNSRKFVIDVAAVMARIRIETRDHARQPKVPAQRGDKCRSIQSRNFYPAAALMWPGAAPKRRCTALCSAEPVPVKQVLTTDR